MVDKVQPMKELEPCPKGMGRDAWAWALAQRSANQKRGAVLRSNAKNGNKVIAVTSSRGCSTADRRARSRARSSVCSKVSLVSSKEKKLHDEGFFFHELGLQNPPKKKKKGDEIAVNHLLPKYQEVEICDLEESSNDESNSPIMGLGVDGVRWALGKKVQHYGVIKIFSEGPDAHLLFVWDSNDNGFLLKINLGEGSSLVNLKLYLGTKEPNPILAFKVRSDEKNRLYELNLHEFLHYEGYYCKQQKKDEKGNSRVVQLVPDDNLPSYIVCEFGNNEIFNAFLQKMKENSTLSSFIANGLLSDTEADSLCEVFNGNLSTELTSCYEYEAETPWIREEELFTWPFTSDQTFLDLALVNCKFEKIHLPCYDKATSTVWFHNQFNTAASDTQESMLKIRQSFMFNKWFQSNEGRLPVTTYDLERVHMSTMYTDTLIDYWMCWYVTS